MTQDEKNWLAADYALGVMRGAEKLAFEAELKHDRELSQLVLQWQERLTLVQPGQSALCASMSEPEIDDAWPACLSGFAKRWVRSLPSRPLV